jgi:predicted ATPase/DNA-binding winged helix-turn-helix (wHTH) protein
MDPAAETPTAIDFGRFRVLLRRRELVADKRPLELGGRAFDVLMALIEAEGAVVSKDALIERVWPGRVVEENNLQAQISALRRVFGADRDLIRTIAGRGYQFTGEILTVPSQPYLPVTAALPQAVSAPSGPRTNLPEGVSELIGRDAVLAELQELSALHRLVTLAGAGGIGKTRLAIEVARHLVSRFADGVWLAELASLSDPDLVPATVGTALGLESTGGMSAERVAKALSARQVLLVLDNCEHVIDAAAQMTEALLGANQASRVITTSREPLRAAGEWIFPVPPLAVPAEAGTSVDDALQYGAVRLFIERARAAEPRFSQDERAVATIAAICRRLDGIPLAIELAASRAATVGVDEIASRLDRRFDLLTGGRRNALPRQRTLRATLDWSYELLPEIERQVLRRVSVFAGGFMLEAASSVAASVAINASGVVDCVANLVQKSLVTADVGVFEARFRLLETTKAYALEKLTESGEYDDVARRHAEYYRTLLQRAATETQTRRTSEWLAVYSLDIDNVRTALDWAFSSDGDTVTGVELTIASERLWFGLSLMDECRRRVERALSSLPPRESGGAAHAMQLYATLAVVLFNTNGPGSDASTAWTDVLDIAEQLDDNEYRLRALWGLWYNRVSNAECRAALTIAQRYYTIPPSQAGPADRLIGERMVGTSLYYLGDLNGARRHLEHMLIECTAPMRRSHIMRFQFDLPVAAHGTLARVLWLLGFPDQAKRMSKENAEEARAIDRVASVSLYWALDCECMIGLAVGDMAAAEYSAATLLDYTVKQGLRFWQALGHSYEGQIWIKRGDVVAGVQCLRSGLDELRETRYVLRYPGLLGALAEGMADIGQVTQALAVIDGALAKCEATDERWTMTELLRIRGELVRLAGTSEASAAAEDHFLQGIDWARRQGALSWELRCATSLARLWHDQGRSRQAHELLTPVYDRFTEGFATSDLRTAKLLIEETSLPV